MKKSLFPCICTAGRDCTFEGDPIHGGGGRRYNKNCTYARRKGFFCIKVVCSLRFFDDYIEHSCSHEKIPFPLHMHRRTRHEVEKYTIVKNRNRQPTNKTYLKINLSARRLKYSLDQMSNSEITVQRYNFFLNPAREISILRTENTFFMHFLFPKRYRRYRQTHFECTFIADY